MPIIFRATKGSRLTVSEIDGNFQSLSDAVNTKVDSANVIGIVDSAYVQSRQLKFDFLDSAEAISLIDATHVQARQTHYLDSVATQSLIDATYIQANQSNIDSGLVVNLIDSSHIQSRQTQQDFSYTSLTDVPDLFDSVDATILIDSAYVQVRQTPQDFTYNSLTGKPNILDSDHVIRIIGQEGIDSDLTINLVDSAYIQLRDRFQDSSLVTSTVDASYVQARQTPQDFAYSSLTGTPTTIAGYGITDAFDGAYGSLSGTPTIPTNNNELTNGANYVSDTALANNLLNLATNLVPDTDSARDLGTASNKWRQLHLSSNTIFLGTDTVSTDNGELKVNSKSVYDYNSPDNALVALSDKFIETSAELTDAQAPTDPLVVFNTWNRFSHQGSSQPLANQSDLAAWSYNSGTGAVENSLNTASATGFYSPRKHESYTHEATLKSTGSDDDIVGVVVGYVIEDGKHYTLSAIRQTHGGFVASGLMWGLVFNLGQSGHGDATRDQALISNGTSLGTAGNGNASDWNAFPNGTKVYVRKIGASLSIKTSQFNSTNLDNDTEITFDLSSDSRTQRFAGSVPYGYIAQSQGPASFSGLSFTPDIPESIIHFQGNGATAFYQYNSGTSNWDTDTNSTLSDRKGKIYHNDKTGRTFFNDGDNVVPIGTVRQFNDVLYQVPQSSAPTATTIGALGLKPGMFAVADGTNWDPSSKGGSVPYPVFWDGTQWNALY